MSAGDLVTFVEETLGIELLPWQAAKLRQWRQAPPPEPSQEWEVHRSDTDEWYSAKDGDEAWAVVRMAPTLFDQVRCRIVGPWIDQEQVLIPGESGG